VECHGGTVFAQFSGMAIRESQSLVQKPTVVAAPLTLGFADCFALLLGLMLMLISAMVPTRARR
ncbi:MAG TPA: hypothetical protein VMR29_11185, partial [Candidatus Binatia bacterium]|nr:hypothetical protein [Candidatus Binatia bacterium]